MRGIASGAFPGKTLIQISRPEFAYELAFLFYFLNKKIMTEIRIDDLKKLLVENCMLKVSPEEIQEETPLFGPGSIGLDSLDALQMTVAIEKTYKIAIPDPETAKQALQSLGTLRDWLNRQALKA